MIDRHFAYQYPILAEFAESSTHYKRRSKKGKISLVKKGKKKRKKLTAKQLVISSLPVFAGVGLGYALGGKIIPTQSKTYGDALSRNFVPYSGSLLGGAAGSKISNHLINKYRNE